ncbi:uncharacterized protein LOC111869546 [Cryptotermes secundus]|uniref:uncharacterized protein LOC111869546 n=1 Tax=Cryptotermes secundus TaxID=105785 RepID=UPI000CD7BC49|nr:uncharacterized protein LOC111869546 [Cryptotermes secundus]
MKDFLVKSGAISIFWILLAVLATARAEDSYCFRFTWMGPAYNNGSYMNSSTTCADVYDACRDPMVITNDSTTPNFTYIWTNFLREQVSCRLSADSVCAKWTRYYEDKVEYTMHTCSKITVEGEPAMTSGCVTSVTNNSRRTEVCACKSFPGMQPCNSGRQSYTPVTVLLLLNVFFVTLKSVT